MVALLRDLQMHRVHNLEFVGGVQLHIPSGKLFRSTHSGTNLATQTELQVLSVFLKSVEASAFIMEQTYLYYL